MYTSIHVLLSYAKFTYIFCEIISRQCQTNDLLQLTKIISNGICNADISRILDEVLQICSESESLYAKRVKLVESTLRALGKAKVSISHANEIINRIAVDFPMYPKLHLVKLVEFCLASIRSNDDEFRRYMRLLYSYIQRNTSKKCNNTQVTFLLVTVMWNKNYFF